MSNLWLAVFAFEAVCIVAVVAMIVSVNQTQPSAHTDASWLKHHRPKERA